MGTTQRSSVQLELVAGTGGGPADHARRAGAAARRRQRSYRLDARTREIGREGVAQAREILANVQPPEPPGHRRAS